MWKIVYCFKKRNFLIKFIIILIFITSIVIFNSNFWTSDLDTVNYPIKKYSEELEKFRKNLQCSQILKRTTKCTEYFSSLASIIYNNNISNHKSYVEKYINSNQKRVKAKTRIAVSYIIHQDPGLFEILFHLIFRPYHSYCIYIDPKTSEDLQNAFQSIVKCYQEFFINTTIIIVSGTGPIFHGGFSLLNADLTCLELLYHSSRYSYLKTFFVKLII